MKIVKFADKHKACDMKAKIKLSQLEQFLIRIADQLRKSMEESEYKEYIFGLLFLKRLSKVFEEKREELLKDYKHLPFEVQNELLEDKSTYGETLNWPTSASPIIPRNSGTSYPFSFPNMKKQKMAQRPRPVAGSRFF